MLILPEELSLHYTTYKPYRPIWDEKGNVSTYLRVFESRGTRFTEFVTAKNQVVYVHDSIYPDIMLRPVLNRQRTGYKLFFTHHQPVCPYKKSNAEIESEAFAYTGC